MEYSGIRNYDNQHNYASISFRCKKCKHSVNSEDRYCSNCGHILEQSEALRERVNEKVIIDMLNDELNGKSLLKILSKLINKEDKKDK